MPPEIKWAAEGEWVVSLGVPTLPFWFLLASSPLEPVLEEFELEDAERLETACWNRLFWICSDGL